jgi:hypothetical protein
MGPGWAGRMEPDGQAGWGPMGRPGKMGPMGRPGRMGPNEQALMTWMVNRVVKARWAAGRMGRTGRHAWKDEA